jgi:quinol monooxygenase YgiN
MSTAHALPPAAVIINHTVANYDQWKTHFDQDEGERKAAGMLGHHINRGHDNPNDVSIYLALTDVPKAQAFATSPRLKTFMQAAGVTGAPHATFMTPVHENLVWDRALPAMMVTHTVADFDTWFAGYQRVASLRQKGGIIGDAVNRDAANPNTVVIYHQAESHDALTAYANSPELKTAMQELGVTSAPTFTFVTGGWAKNY